MADTVGKIVVKITNETENISHINQTVDFKMTNFSDYSKMLQNIQKQTNVILTKLVELRSAEDIAMEDENEEESDDDDASKKRKIVRKENRNKKNKV